MTEENKSATYDALHNAAEMIRSHVEGGGIGEDDFTDYTIDQYRKACDRAFKLITTLADRYARD